MKSTNYDHLILKYYYWLLAHDAVCYMNVPVFQEPATHHI